MTKISAKDRTFYSGVISSLLVIVDHDQETIAFEILKGCDLAVVRRIAVEEEDEKIVKLVDDYRRMARERERFARESLENRRRSEADAKAYAKRLAGR